MAKGAYIGLSSKARKAKKMYIGVGGVARKVKKAYIGVNGVAKLWWSGSSGFVWWAGYTYNGNQKVESGDALGTALATMAVGSGTGGYYYPVRRLCAWKGKVWTYNGRYVYYSSDVGRTWTSIYNSLSAGSFSDIFPMNDDYLALAELNNNAYYICRISKDAQTALERDRQQVTILKANYIIQCDDYLYISHQQQEGSTYYQTLIYNISSKTRTTISYILLQRAAASSSRIVAVYKNTGNNTKGLGYVDKGGTSMTMVDSSYDSPSYNNQVAAAYWKNKFWFYRPNLTYYSTDGTSWSSQASAPSGFENESVFPSSSNQEKMYIPRLLSSGTNRYGYSYTTDGLTWTAVGDASNRYFWCILDNPDV